VRRRARSALTFASVAALLLLAATAPSAEADLSDLYLVRADNSVLTSESPISSISFTTIIQGGSHGFGSGGGGEYLVADGATFTKPIGKDSPELLEAVAKGTHFKELRIQFSKPSTPYLRYCFHDVLFSSLQLQQSSGSGQLPAEVVSFSYSTLVMEYQPGTSNLSDGCDSNTKNGQSEPKLDAWVIKLNKETVSLGVACLSKRCAGTIKMLSQRGACAANACKPLGQARFKLKGGAAKTISMPLTEGGRSKLKRKTHLPVSLFGALNGHRQELIRKNALALSAGQKLAPISLSCPSRGSVGSPLTFTGGVKTRAATSVPVQITFAGPGGRLMSVSAFSDPQGNFSTDFIPDVAGEWTALASWPGSATERPSQSAGCGTSVSAPPVRSQSTLTLSCPASTILTDVATVFSGTLTPPQSGQTVHITYSNLSTGAAVIHDATLDAAGNYSDSFTPGSASGWTAVAHYPGDASVLPADSPTCEFKAG
jgi:type VI protein secretion system component Hcp